MTVNRKPVVVVGSINIDLVAKANHIPVEGETVMGSEFQVHPGGKGANQAVAVARLGYPVCMIGRLGEDAFGAQLRQHLQTSGVEVSGIATSPGASGVAVIVVAAGGENSIVIAPGANAQVTPADLDAHVEVLRSAAIVLTQLEIPLETVEHLAELCIRVGVPLVLDPAPARELPSRLLKQVAWFTPNETEAAFFMNGEPGLEKDAAFIVQSLRKKGIQGVVLKLGSKGAYVSASDGIGEYVDSYPVAAVDSTAAGDCFNGAFATGLSRGMGPVESVRFATAAAALSVTRAGAQPSMPTVAEVNSLRGINTAES